MHEQFIPESISFRINDVGTITAINYCSAKKYGFIDFLSSCIQKARYIITRPFRSGLADCSVIVLFDHFAG
jgi:hypothetical protein